MAMLKSSVIQGSLRVTDTTYTTNLNLSSGTASQIVKTDANKNLITGTLAASEIPNLSANKITSDTLSADRIPNLAASKINSGTFDAARIPNLSATKITSDTLGVDRIPNLAASKINSGTFDAARIPTLSITDKTSGTLTVARGGTNLTSITQGGIIYAASTSAYGCTSAGTANQILVSGGTSAPTWKATASGAAYATSSNGALTFGTLPIAQGGTGITTTDPHKVLIGPITGSSAAAPTWREPTYMDMAPIDKKTYTNVIATLNSSNVVDQETGGFFYAKVRGVSYDAIWHTKFRITATVPGNVNFYATSIYDLWGFANTYSAYKCQNAIRNTSYRPLYYNTYFRINSTGYTNGMGGWVGFSLLSSNSPIDTNAKRTVTVELLEYDNCTVEMQDTLVTPTNIPNRTTSGYYNSTNTAYDNFDFCNNGLRETGDDNSTSISTLYEQYGGWVAANLLCRYQLVFENADHKFVSIFGTDNAYNTTNKTLLTVDFDPNGRIFYHNTSGTTAANANIDSGRLYYAVLVDLRYSFNVTSTASSTTFTGTRYTSLYLKTQMTASTGMVHVASNQPLVTTLPTSNDSYYYIYLGQVHNWYQVMMTGEHPVYYHNGTTIVQYLGKNLSGSFIGNISGNATNVTGTVAVGHGGTGTTTAPTQGGVIYGSSTTAYACTGAGSSGQFLKSNGTGAPTWATITTTDTKVTQAYSTTSGSYPVLLTATAGVSSTSGRGDTTAILNNAIYANPNTGGLYATKVYNAVWNDYAECRKSLPIEPGRVVTEAYNGVMEIANQRLMPACKIVSDTYGTLMGESADAKTPIAVAGRVLVYPYKNIESYHLGDAVCSAPGGTVDVMSREEIQDYPERIVGTVSEIPTYEVWYAGNKDKPTPIQVDGRIWVYVR